MSLVASLPGVDDHAVAFASALVDDAHPRPVDPARETLGDLLTNLDAELLVIPPSRAEELVTEAPCAVAVVPPDVHSAAPVHTVGVAFDGSRSSVRALHWATALAERKAAELHRLLVLHGDPAAELISRSRGLDVLVLGCGHPDQGSVAARVAARAPTAVVVVPLDVDV